MTVRRTLAALALSGAFLLSPVVTTASHAQLGLDRIHHAHHTVNSVSALHADLSDSRAASGPLVRVVAGTRIANRYQRAISPTGGIHVVPSVVTGSVANGGYIADGGIARLAGG